MRTRRTRGSRRSLPFGTALMAGLAPVAGGQAAPTRIENPIAAIGGGDERGLEIEFHPGLRDLMRPADRVILEAVPLPDGPVDLDLRRFDWPPAPGLLAVDGKIMPDKTTLTGLDHSFLHGSVSGEPLAADMRYVRMAE